MRIKKYEAPFREQAGRERDGVPVERPVKSSTPTYSSLPLELISTFFLPQGSAKEGARNQESAGEEPELGGLIFFFFL